MGRIIKQVIAVLALVGSAALAHAGVDVGVGRSDINAHTGTFTTSIPIPVSPGTAGLQPALSLNYASGMGNGLYGLGWDLNLARIERSTKKGVPAYTDADTFVLVMNGSSQALVSVGTDPVSGAPSYRVKNESAFLKITKNADSWTVEDKVGTKYYFGLTGLGQNSSWPAGVAQSFIWGLSTVVTKRLQRSDYYYLNDNNGLRIDHIDYPPNNRVQFTYEARPDILTNYSSGNEMRIGVRLIGVQSYANNAPAPLAYDLQFQYTVLAGDTRSLLTAAIQNSVVAGERSQRKLFGYQNHALDTLASNWKPSTTLTSLVNPCYKAGNDINQAPSGFNIFQIDLDGDGVVDSLSGGDATFPSSNCSVPTRINPVLTSFPAQGSSYPVSMQISPGYYTTKQAVYPRAWIDLNGDGMLDWLVKDANADFTVYFSKGTDVWSAPATWLDPVTDPTGRKAVGFYDVNGDGLPDRVNGSLAWINTGIGFSATSIGFAAPAATYAQTAAIPGFTPHYPLTWNGPVFGSVLVYLPNQWSQTPLLTTITNDNMGTVQSINYSLQNVTGMPSSTMKVWAVSQTTTSGSEFAETRTVNYSYTGGKFDWPTKEFRGFASVTATNGQSGIVTTTTYLQDLVYQGRPSAIEVRLANGTLISRTATTWNSLGYNLDANQNYQRNFVFPQQIVTSTYETNGTLVTTTTTDNNYGAVGDLNPGNLLGSTSKTSDGYVKIMANVYDTSNNLIQADVTSYGPGQAPKTRSSSFTYTAYNEVETETVEPNSPQLTVLSTHTYHPSGNRTSTTVSGTNFATRTTSTTYDPYGQFPISSTNALGHTENYTWDGRFGVKTSLTGPNGLTTSWTYDGLGRKTAEIRADGTRTDIKYENDRYNPDGTLKTAGWKLYILETSTGAPYKIVYFDSYGRERVVQSPNFNGQATYVYSAYNAKGQLSSKSDPYVVAADRKDTVYVYDDLGRTTSVTEPDGGVTTTVYNGLTTTVTNPKLQTETVVKNSQGKPLYIYNAISNAIAYTYDQFGNLATTNATPGGLKVITTMIYDLLGRKTSMIDPDMGSWSYEYDALGNLIRQTDAKGQITTMTYDLLGRMTSRTEPDGTATWSYDTAANGIGKIASENSSNGVAKVYSYDTLGRATSETTTIGGVAYAVSTTYDGASRIYRTNYPSGLAIRNVYKAYGYVSKVENVISGAAYWTGNSVDALGNLNSETLGNGITTATTRNYYLATGATMNVVATNAAATTVQSNSFTWDTIGNLTSRSDAVTGMSETFGYDNLNRLTSVTGPTPMTLAYDALGNITNKSGVGAYQYNYAFQPHAVIKTGGTIPYAYDANGNMLSGGGRSYTWMSFNKPSTVAANGSTTYYSYDAGHERVAKSNATSSTIYIGKLYEKQTNLITGAASQKSYIYAAGKMVAAVETSGASTATKYFLHDHLGSIAAITDANGAVLERLGFDAFGKPRNPDGTTASIVALQTTRGYTGHEMDAESGLINMNARLYDPNLGRFISPDTMIPDAGNMQEYNRYTYVKNNPLSYTDPTGHWSLKNFWKAAKPIVAIVVAAALTCMGVPPVFVGAISGFINTGTLQGAMFGAVSGGMFAVAGTVASQFGTLAGIAANGMVGGMMSMVAGGNFAQGFYSAAASKALGSMGGGEYGIEGGDVGSIAARTVVSGVIGGVSSRAGGGDFWSGFQTGAFQRLCNDEAHLYGYYAKMAGVDKDAMATCIDDNYGSYYYAAEKLVPFMEVAGIVKLGLASAGKSAEPYLRASAISNLNAGKGFDAGMRQLSVIRSFSTTTNIALAVTAGATVFAFASSEYCALKIMTSGK